MKYFLQKGSSKKKKCIIFLVGIIRNINIIDLCGQNLNDYLININPHYEFKIVLSTQLKYVATRNGKLLVKNVTGDQPVELYKEHDQSLFESKYRKYYKNIEIFYHEMPVPIECRQAAWHYRMYQLFKNNSYINYDIMIYMRTDTLFTQKMFLDQFLDGIYNITRKGGGGWHTWHTRDYDFCWMGKSKLVKLYFYLNFKMLNQKYAKHNCNSNINIFDKVLSDCECPDIENVKLNNMEIDDLHYMYKKMNLNGDVKTQYTVINDKYNYSMVDHMINFYLLKQNYKITVADKLNLFTECASYLYDDAYKGIKI